MDKLVEHNLRTHIARKTHTLFNRQRNFLLIFFAHSVFVVAITDKNSLHVLSSEAANRIKLGVENTFSAQKKDVIFIENMNRRNVLRD